MHLKRAGTNTYKNSHRTHLEQLLTPIETRLEAIEHQPTKNHVQDNLDTSRRKPATGPSIYPLEIRQIAVQMRHEGRTNREIIDMIHQHCGKAPDPKNITKLLKLWIEKKDDQGMS